MIPFIGPIINGVLGVGKQYLANKADVANAIHKRKLTSIEGDQNWEAEQAKNSNNSWKDEYLTIIITSPFVAMFLAAVLNKPEMVERISDAFIILQTNVPPEYWYLLGVCFGASFAIKGVPNVLNKLRGKK
tara:strand:+ start:200 stop:592 length:393 start_codon:yes stop_codon:yes gene_type:complete